MANIIYIADISIFSKICEAISSKSVSCDTKVINGQVFCALMNWGDICLILT